MNKNARNNDIGDVNLGKERINRTTKEYKYDVALFRYLVDKGKITPLTDKEKNEHKWNRYVKPAVPHTGLKYPKMNGSNKPLRSYSLMTEKQKQFVLEVMDKGVGRVAACDQAGCTLPMFKKTCEADPDFKDKIIHLDARIDETLDDIVWVDAIDNRSSAAAIALRKLRMDIKQKEFNKRMERAKLRQKERELDIKEQSCGAIVDQITSKRYLQNLSNEELDRYDYLDKNISILSQSEKIEYADLIAKISGPSEQAAKALSAINKINQSSSDDQSNEDDDDDDDEEE